MGMTIDEIILKETEIAQELQKVIDTHMVSEDMSLEEMYCDDTEVIEEELERCKELSDYHSTIANIMRKYQKIQEIVGNYGFATSWFCLKKISEVLEDGNND
jgi:hypothetical protein